MILEIKKIGSQDINSYYVNDVEYRKWKGSSCDCFVGLSNDRKYLIKKFLFTPEDSLEEAQKLHQNITSIIKTYNDAAAKDNIPYNYLMRDAYIGHSIDKKIYYQIFPYINGSTVKYATTPTYKPDDVKCILRKYIHLLHSLKIICNQFNHLDISLSNIYEYSDSTTETKYEIFDFGSLQSKEDFYFNALDWSFKSPSSLPYYLPMEVEALKDHFYLYNGELSILNVLDTSACARVLAAILFGEQVLKDNNSLPLTSHVSIKQITKYINNIEHEGVQFALHRFFNKALRWNDKEDGYQLERRYLSFEEMIIDVNAIIDSFEEFPKVANGIKIKALQSSEIQKLKLSYENKHLRHSVSVNDLIDEIVVQILPDIRQLDVSGFEHHYSLKVDSTPLLQLIQQNYGHAVLLIGPAGSAKSTMLQLEYLRNIVDLEADKLFLYVPLKEYDISIQSTIEKISTLKITQMIPSQTIILLDGFDEIPDRRMCKNNTATFDNKFFSDIKDLSDMGYTCIVTSRTAPRLEKEYFGVAIVQDIRPSQQANFLYEKTGKKFDITPAMEYLLKNAFMLTIFAELCNSKSIFQDINCSFSIVEQYFKSIINNKTGIIGKELNDEWVYICEMISELAYQQNRQLFGEDDSDRDYSYEKMGRYWRSVADSIDKDGLVGIIHIDSEEKTLIFSHEIFREFFVSCQAARAFLKVLSNKSAILGVNPIASRGFFVKYMPYLTHQTILFIADHLRIGAKDPLWVDLKNDCDTAEELLENILYRTKYPDILCRSLRIPWGVFSGHVYWYFDFSKKKQGTNSIQHFIFVLTQLAYNKPNTFENYDFNYNKAISYISGFAGCELIQRVSIPAGAKMIGKKAFNNCTNLQYVILPKSIRSVHSHAFDGCVSLKEIQIPPRCTIIRRNGSIVSGKRFSYPSGFAPAKLEIGSHVRKIQSGFVSTQNLQELIVHNPHYQVVTNCLIDTRTNTLMLAYGDFKIPDSVTSIGKYAFVGNNKLTSIVLPPNIKRIHPSAFYGCTNLVEIKTYNEAITKIRFII